MGTGYSLDMNEHRAAADVIDGYGDIQAEHGSTLASATSTPLSSSGTGISGAISQIAQGTLQKIVTDVTSTTQGFARDTAQGLRTQADNAEKLETELAGNTKAILNDTPASLLGSGFTGGGLSSGFGSSSPLTSYGSGGLSSMSATPLTGSTPLDEGSSAESESGLAGAGIAAEEAPQESSTAMMSQPMRGGMGGAGSTEERGQRPDYLKSKTELSDKDGGKAKAAIDKHLKECGAAPIPLSADTLVCAKCGSILTIEDDAVPAGTPSDEDPLSQFTATAS